MLKWPAGSHIFVKWPVGYKQFDHAVTGLPDENFNKKPNNAKKRPAKGRIDCLKASKKPNFNCGIAIPLSPKDI